uniref:F-box domain-containing protein n=1 Tax=Panagrolaimus davidi TaxID=227884 RepID=A0A914PII1_9BILA
MSSLSTLTSILSLPNDTTTGVLATTFATKKALSRTMHPSWNPATSNIRIFEYPNDVIKYMKQNAAPKQLLNLMQCSKRFCHKVFPYLPVQDLTADEEDGWCMQKLDNLWIEGTDFDEIPNGLWITGEFNLCGDFPNLLPQILPKVAVIELEQLFLIDQEISCDDLVKLLSHGSVKYIHFRSSTVRYGNGDVVPLDKILEILTNIPEIFYLFDLPPFSLEAAENLSKVIVSPKLVEFSVIAHKEEFNFGLYKKFIELNRQILFDTVFVDDDLEDDFIEELEHLNAITLQNGLNEYAPHIFEYIGMPEETRHALYNLRDEYRKLHNTE